MRLVVNSILFVGFLIGHGLWAQSATAYTWWNPAKTDFPVREGQAWPGEIKDPYDRFPARAQSSVPAPVWDLSHQSAGLLLRFATPANQIVVRYTVTRPPAMAHMPATGVSGVDLYALDADGNWLWSAGKYAFRDTIEYRFTGLDTQDLYPQGREYRLYLPLYNAVNWMEIGVPIGSSLTPLPARTEKPLVVYGTSIAQGACASRPGMAWTALLGRALDRPLINLGFSGYGRLDGEVIDLMADIDAAVFIIDCLPNVAARSGLKPEEVSSRLRYAVRTLRQKYPTTPIVLTDHFGYSDSGINPANRSEYQAINAVQQRTLAQLQAEGVRDLYRLPIETLKQDIDAMVDGKHPSDLGMLRYAEAYTTLLREVLNEPVGGPLTTQPRPQCRGLSAVASDARHRTVLQQKKTNPPQLVVLGDSIAFGLGHAMANQPGMDAQSRASLANLGVPGDRLENVLWRVYHDELTGYKAQQIILTVGTAHLIQQADADILTGFTQLIQAIRHRQPGASVLVLGLLPNQNQKNRILRLNQKLAKLTNGLTGHFLDIRTAFTTYQQLARYLKPYVRFDKKLVLSPVQPAGLNQWSR